MPIFRRRGLTQCLMPSTRLLPHISNEQNAPYESIRQKSRNSKRWKHRQKEPPDNKLTLKTTELVREDVYLMDSKSKRISANLLANSLTARLRKNLPEGVMDHEHIKKIRRDSLKDFVHLDNLQRQFNSEMQRENSRLDKETYHLLKRQKQLQKHSEMQRRKHDKLSSSLRSRSDLSSASLPPLLLDECNQSVDQTKEVFPEFAKVDKDDQSHVKVFKLKGVYQPMNKYHNRIEPFQVTSKDSVNKVEQTNGEHTARSVETMTAIDLGPRTSRTMRKGLRVSWSRQSKYYVEAPRMDTARTDGQTAYVDSRSENTSPDASIKGQPRRMFNSRLSMRSDSFLIQSSKTFKGRRKVETVGLQWKLPPKAPTHPVPEMAPQVKPIREPNQGRSRNLVPVTSALAKEGLSAKTVCWQVQKPQRLSQMENYTSWLGKLELLKCRESVESSLHQIPDRAHLSVMSQPAC